MHRVEVPLVFPGEHHRERDDPARDRPRLYRVDVLVHPLQGRCEGFPVGALVGVPEVLHHDPVGRPWAYVRVPGLQPVGVTDQGNDRVQGSVGVPRHHRESTDGAGRAGEVSVPVVQPLVREDQERPVVT